MKKVNLMDYLDEVTAFSLEHEEPAWMTELRTTALRNADESELPHIDRVKFHRWPLLNVTWKVMCLLKEMSQVLIK